MRLVEYKLSAASSSALILTIAKSLYNSGWSREYISRIDFSAVEKLAAELYTISPLYHTLLQLRKRMVRYLIDELLEQHPRQQICILAAGLDPLGLQIAEHYPTQLRSIYEIDKAHMHEKQELYASVSFNEVRLHHLYADITNPPLMMETLIKAGYTPHEPTLIIFEGIMHSITEEQFLRIMRAFCSRARNNAVIMDYILPQENLPSAFVPRANDMLEVMETATGSRLKQYSRKKIMNLLSLLEAEIFDVYDMQAAEYVLNGRNKMYHTKGEGMMEMVAFSI
ncbi:Leucine carboxyl methyltransferase [Chitinophaga sp. CF118]|uniref:class I SAM-dependent methyltransferase n=1 Tax=Chitinophaga sp. CF118 TaxID=1884367 RepID=UPI0008E82D90|nr:class I SAM-dependent methyltransferase [Chitinophaga sp. CF118]SFE31308.1 Leucine carboxyl methyltransferase [Chitinophaga sp. CF118]